MKNPFLSGLDTMPRRVAVIYSATAGAWIVLSDLAVALVLDHPVQGTWVDVIKGIGFVAVSAGLLYLLLRRILAREMIIRMDLEETRERFAASAAHHPYSFAVYDADRRFRYLNPHGLKFLRKTPDEVLGRRDEEVFPLEMVNAYLPALNRAMETRQPQSVVAEVKLASNHVCLAYTFTPLLNADGSVREVLAVTNDMTSVVQNERRVRRLNRTLGAISAANSVLVRATDEASLLRDFCAELAAQTGHRLVWVGFVEGTEGHLRAAEEAGPAAGLLAEIRPGNLLPPADYCVSTKAVQQRQPVICRDYQTEALFEPCRVLAQEAGLRSGVALPLRDDGHMLGALCLYAAEANQFDEQEVKMLAELAEDLTFGLVALRHKQALAQTLSRLRESEERLRTLKMVIDVSPSVAYVARTEPGWPVEFVSDNVARFGYQPSEFTSGQIKVASIAHPDDLPRIMAECEQAVAEGRPQFTQEYRVFDARGQTRWVQDHCIIVRNTAGLATHFQGILTDITERKQAEAAHRELERLVQGTLDAMTDNICVLEADGAIAYVNASWRRFAAARPPAPEHAAVGSNYFTACEHAHGTPMGAEAAQFIAGTRAVLCGELPEFQMEYSCDSPKEHQCFVARVTPFPAGGRPRVAVAHQNITAQRLAGNQVRDALTYLGTVIEASPVGIISYDETGQAKTANETAARMVGATVAQLLALNFRHIESWKASGLLAAAERALARRQPEQLDVHLITTFGKEIWHTAQFVPFPRGETWHLLLMMTDIAEQKRATAQLRLQGAALNAAANSIVITDTQGLILWVNEAFTKTTGYLPADVLGQNPRLLKSGRHSREFYEAMWKAILAGQSWHGEMCNRRKDGTLYDEEQTIAPVRDSTGAVTNFIAIKQDITEKKNLEKQFLRAQRLEGIGLLAGGIAHDLNNVLAPILMGADLLKMQMPDDRFTQQLDSINQSARRGADIVKQVLTFARGMEGERVVLHPKHILKEMVHMARETFPRNIALSADIPNDLWPVVGDPTQLHQVLLNLSVNARDALAEGGDLIYSAANAEVDAAHAHANPGAKAGPHVILRVQDTGTGIPPEVLDRMFEPFFTTKEQGKGTGLGLSTVLGIVRSHGGFITVSSEVGRGTTFEVYLPANPQAASDAPPAQREPVPTGKGELVLVVDDEADILQVTRSMLERYGYRVLTATDGTSAITELSRHLDEMRLIITDIMMPFMDGVQLIRAAHRLSPQLRIIASSGALGMPGQKDRTDEVRALGVQHIVHKPYTVEALLRTVHAELHPGTPAG